MLKFTLKRLLQFAVVLICASILIFVMVRMSDTDPIAVILGGKQTSPEVIEALKVKFHLDRNLFEQYIIWITGMLHGDFGLSFQYQSPVAGLVSARVPVTLGLVLFGSVRALLAAIPLGVFCALKKNSWIDRAVSICILVLAGCPPFLTCIIMILIVSKVNPAYPFVGTFSNLTEFFTRMALPSVALAFVMLALAARVTRSSMIDQQNAPYTQTAIAKGASTGRIVWKHNIRNAIIPVIAVVSIQIGGMVVGAVLVENVFSLAGLGTLLIDSIKASDYNIVQAITMLLIVIFLVISTVVDILYALIDPRIRVK